MSDDEHYFESSDAGASQTYPQQADTIRVNGYMVIKGRPCKINLLTENGSTKDDLKLPTDEALLTELKAGFEEGKNLIVSVMTAMGEEQICNLKEVGPE